VIVRDSQEGAEGEESASSPFPPQGYQEVAWGWSTSIISSSGAIEQLTSGGWLLSSGTEEIEAEIEMSEEVIRLLGILGGRE
jgi:hypothetical protein